MKKDLINNTLELMLLNDLLLANIIDEELFKAAKEKIAALTEDGALDATRNTVVPAWF